MIDELEPLDKCLVPVKCWVNNDPCHQEAGKIRHKSFLDNLVDSTISLIVDAESWAVEEDVSARSETKSTRRNIDHVQPSHDSVINLQGKTEDSRERDHSPYDSEN